MLCRRPLGTLNNGSHAPAMLSWVLCTLVLRRPCLSPALPEPQAGRCQPSTSLVEPFFAPGRCRGWDLGLPKTLLSEVWIWPVGSSDALSPPQVLPLSGFSGFALYDACVCGCTLQTPVDICETRSCSLDLPVDPAQHTHLRGRTPGTVS